MDGVKPVFGIKFTIKRRKIQEINVRVIQYQNQADCLYERVWKMVKYEAMGRQMGKIGLKKVWSRESKTEKSWKHDTKKFLVGNLPLHIISVMELLALQYGIMGFLVMNLLAYSI